LVTHRVYSPSLPSRWSPHPPYLTGGEIHLWLPPAVMFSLGVGSRDTVLVAVVAPGGEPLFGSRGAGGGGGQPPPSPGTPKRPSSASAAKRAIPISPRVSAPLDAGLEPISLRQLCSREYHVAIGADTAAGEESDQMCDSANRSASETPPTLLISQNLHDRC
jgi:hypothetical protein